MSKKNKNKKKKISAKSIRYEKFRKEKPAVLDISMPLLSDDQNKQKMDDQDRIDRLAATPKGPQKAKLDFNVDRPTYDAFMKMCSQRGYSSTVVIERMMKKFVETGTF